MIFLYYFRCDIDLCLDACNTKYGELTSYGDLSFTAPVNDWNVFKNKKVGEIACVGAQYAHALKNKGHGVCKQTVSNLIIYIANHSINYLVKI